MYTAAPATYGERMTDALRRVKTEYTLLMLDDFFLREPVKMDRLHDLVRWMDADRDIVYFSSDITEALYDWEVDRYPGLPPPAGGQPLHAEYAGRRSGALINLLSTGTTR